MPTIHEKVESMSDAELLAYLEEEQPTPGVLEAIKRFRVAEPKKAEPEPYKPSCHFCGGSGVSLHSRKPCKHCQGQKST